MIDPATRIGAVHLTISDLRRSVRFYETHLGFAVHRRDERTAWLGVGLLLGLSQYVRTIGLVLLPAFAVLPFLVGVPPRRATIAALSLVVVFGVVLAPSVAWQYERYGRLSFSTSNFDGWNLLVGSLIRSFG